MAHTTKRTLSETLKKILQEKSLDKVTVVDIVEASAINRQTFYYHFKDIYDLVEWTFLTDNTQSLSGKRSYATWQQGYLQIFDYVGRIRALSSTFTIRRVEKSLRDFFMILHTNFC